MRHDIKMKRLNNSPESYLPLTPVAFEILLALAEGERHGYDVMVEIERRSAGRISPNPGTLYRALDRLVHEGLLTSALRSVDGESRRVFSVSPLGRAVAAAEAARLSDQVLAARSLRLFRRGGA
jgi:DNA-binding PadR family transcriptional regulator